MSTYFEVEPQAAGTFDPLTIVRDCVENDAQALLFDNGALPPVFFDLSSGVAGDLLHRLSAYQIRMAGVVPDPAAYSPRFQEFMHEAKRGRQYRFFADREAAIQWLAGE